MAAGTLLVALGEVQGQQVFRDGFEESCLVDSDADRLMNCEEVALATDYSDPDTDGDGLGDGDEVLGTPGGLDLPAFGVNPRHKDVLVEMDWDVDSRGCGVNHAHRPQAQAIAEVRLFYAAVPVPNPDGADGINFIADFGQGPPPFVGGDVVDFANGVTGSLGVDFFGQKALHFSPERAGYFRYQVHAHYWRDNDGSSGIANIVGDNSVVSLNCAFKYPDNVRNTIIHELGHNFGLDHGGNSPCNGKPNYNSLMNYSYQFPGLDVDCDGTPDGADNIGYSVGTRTLLVQGNLNEAQGLCPADHPLHQAIDWNGNGTIDPGRVSYPGSLSFAPPECVGLAIASDHDDYAALELPPASPPGGNGAPTPGFDSEPCPAPPENSPEN